ncbi:WD40-repeat-containing domain protein [Lentinula raphanica]|nr:WD40-repeat-containing domain protein [Lentinula raphanica]
MPSKWQETRYIPLPQCSDPKKIITSMSLSSTTQYLAVGYGKQADVWNIKDAAATSPHSTYTVRATNMHSESSTCSSIKDNVSCLIWSQDIPRLAIGRTGGSVHVVTLDEGISANISGFLHSATTPALATKSVAVTFLGNNVIASAMGRIVELRKLHITDTTSRWLHIGEIPPPPVYQGKEVSGNADIQSIYAFNEDNVLVSYEDGSIVVWKVHLSGNLFFEFKNMKQISGVVNDVCADTILATDFEMGTYTLWPVGSGEPIGKLIPRGTELPPSSQPVCVAKFINSSLVIGGGVGQILLWDVTEFRRLQTLRFCNQANLITDHLTFAYNADEDYGVIVSGHNHSNRGEMIIWQTVDTDE